MFEFLKFWKKKEPEFPGSEGIAPPEKPDDLTARPPAFGAGSDFPGSSDFPRPSAGLAPEQPSAFRAQEAPIERPAPPGVASAESPAENKDLQLVNAKLDAIKAGIDHINARLDKMERKEEKEIVAWR